MAMSRLLTRSLPAAALLACADAGDRVTDGALRLADRARQAWSARTVLLYVDVSASVDPVMVREPVARVAHELSIGDRLVLLAVGDRADEPPLLDTTFAGAASDRLSAHLGLSTRQSAASAARLGKLLEARVTRAVEHARARRGPTAHTALADALCDAAEHARALPGHRVLAVLVTDGIEDSRWTRREPLRLTRSSASRFAALLRSERPCSLASENLSIRLIGVRHPTSTAGLVGWWMVVLRALGYSPRATDIAPYRLGPVLSVVGHSRQETAWS